MQEPITPPSFEHIINHKKLDEDIWSPPNIMSRTASRRSKTPTPSSKRPLSRQGSRRCTTPTSLSRSPSRRNATENSASSLKRIMSRRGTSASLSRSMSRLEISEPELLSNPSVSPPSKDHVQGTRSSEGTDHIPSVSLSNHLSRKSTTPIIFSQTTARRKPPEVEKKLYCSLEDLCFGCTKKIKVTRDVIKHPGYVYGM